MVPRDTDSAGSRRGFLGLGGFGDLDPAYSVFDRLRHLHETPLRSLRRSIWWVRKTFFTRPRTPTPAYLVALDKPAAVAFFGARHFEYVEGNRYNWWQVHVRGFHHADGGLELAAHYETDPTEHPDAHVSLYGLDVDAGMAAMQDVMDEGGLDYEYLVPAARTGIEE